MRQATIADAVDIIDALLLMLLYSPAPQMKHADPYTASDNVQAACAEGRVWFVGGYAIMVEVGCDWYSNKPYLIEQIILKVHKNDKTKTVQDAVAALDDLREHYGCVLTCVGDTQIGYMTPIYEAAGYKVVGTQLIKEP
jgi:hypothetical protein